MNFTDIKSSFASYYKSLGFNVQADFEDQCLMDINCHVISCNASLLSYAGNYTLKVAYKMDIDDKENILFNSMLIESIDDIRYLTEHNRILQGIIKIASR